MIIVIDYGRGNLFSIGQALRHLGASFQIAQDPAMVLTAERVILPGVGAFGDAVAGLKKRSLIEPLREVAARGVPFLGICLGMQLLTTCSEEFGFHRGLNLIPGVVKRLPDGNGNGGAVRIPNVGWRPLKQATGHPVMDGLGGQTKALVYFAHSFAVVTDDPKHTVATIEVNGSDVAAIIRRDNVVGYQFHPEKSGPQGIELFRKFLKMPVKTEVSQ